MMSIVRKWNLGLVGMAIIWLATTAQAQLFINIYPSQDNDNQTIWIFSGSSTAHYGSSIRSSQNFHRRDSWKAYGGDLYTANKPTNSFFNLSPLFSSANNPVDIESVQTRITTSFTASVTNAPTITIGNTSRPIGSLFMNDAHQPDGTHFENVFDEIGIRITPPNLVYSSNTVSRWFGAGILNKPIGDFLWGNDFSDAERGVPYYLRSFQTGAPYFAGNIANSIQISVHALTIPEPAEYALVFGLFALAFVIVRRRFQKKGLN